MKHFSAYCLKDSFTFVDKIKEIEAKNTFIASFYVKILFTKVPLEEVIEICADTLYKISKPTISKINFKKLLKLATSGTKFSFNTLIYWQEYGIAMGSPLGPTLAKILMGLIELKVVPAF